MEITHGGMEKRTIQRKGDNRGQKKGIEEGTGPKTEVLQQQ